MTNTQNKNPLIDDSDYSFAYWEDEETAIVYNNYSGEKERFVARPDGYSGWHLVIDGVPFEFCSSVV